MTEIYHYETIDAPDKLENIKRLFAEYTLEDAVDWSDYPDDTYIVYNRNGSQYTLYYEDDKLAVVYIDSLHYETKY